MKLYSIYDTIKNEMSPPFLAKTDGQAWREYHMLVGKDPYARDHTDEFHLYYLADFDMANGDIYDPQLGKLTDKTIPYRMIQSVDTEGLFDKEKTPNA